MRETIKNPISFKNLGLFFRRILHLLARPIPRRKGLAVHPYRGYGTRDEVFVLGRVLRQTVSPEAGQRGKLSQDLRGFLRRMIRRGAPDAGVEVQVAQTKASLKADGDGYFRGRIALSDPLPSGTLTVDGAFRTGGPDLLEVTCPIHIAPSDSRFIVVSDIDDTVVHTGVARKAAMLWNTFMEGAESRVAFPGVAAFYRALNQGIPGNERNPLLYVSRGPWSIYEVIQAFLAVHRFPEGPVLLRDWGMTLRHPLPRRGKGHKERIIREILDHFAPVPFVLIGDSGQGDPEIYADIVHEYPGRILAVYIRNVTRTRDRDGAIEKLGREVEAAGSALVLAKDSYEMARHAVGAGLISEEALPEILGEIRSTARSEG